jgi:putative FmdB family regulatory protein
MPIYEYQCENGHKIEIMQGVNKPKIKECTVCKGKLYRIISSFNISKNAGVHIFSRDHGGKDILHDKTMTNKEQDAIISDMLKKKR